MALLWVLLHALAADTEAPGPRDPGDVDSKEVLGVLVASSISPLVLVILSCLVILLVEMEAGLLMVKRPLP